MPLFRAIAEWSSLTSTQPKLNEFKPTDDSYNVTFARDALDMTNVSTGWKITGKVSQYPLKTFCKDWNLVSRQYDVSGGLGGAFNIFRDGTAELISFGSGLPVVGIVYGQIEIEPKFQ
jgi:hypothetical protein